MSGIVHFYQLECKDNWLLKGCGIPANKCGLGAGVLAYVNIECKYHKMKWKHPTSVAVIKSILKWDFRKATTQIILIGQTNTYQHTHTYTRTYLQLLFSVDYKFVLL